MRGHRGSSTVEHSTHVDDVGEVVVCGEPGAHVGRHEALGDLEPQSAGQFDAPGEELPVDRRHGQGDADALRRDPGHTVDLQVVGVAVAAVDVVGEQQDRPFGAQDLGEMSGGLVHRRRAERPLRPAPVVGGEARVPVGQELHPRRADGLSGPSGLPGASLREGLVVGEYPGADNADLAPRREHEHHPEAGIDETRERPRVEQGLVVGMGVEGDDGPVRHPLILAGRPRDRTVTRTTVTVVHRPLRIALVSDCYVPRLGGIEMQVHDLARHLVAAGHDVVVLTTTSGPDLVDGVRVHRIDVPLLPFDIPFTRRAFREVRRLLEMERVDVVQFHGGVVSPLAYIGARSAERMGLPTVVTVHCMWDYTTPFFWFLEKVTKWGRWPVVLSAVSEVAATPIRRMARGRSEVVVLPNGIDNDVWRVDPEPGDPDVVTFVSVMRLAPRKRPMHLLRMFHEMVGRLPLDRRARLVVIGDGPELSQMEKFVRTRGLTGAVELVGRRTRDEIRLLFARSDVFVAPANLESFGIAALEARCAGLPVVAKERTGIREFVTHGREGLLAANDRDMVDDMERIVIDDELRRRMTEHNRTVPSPVDWDDVVRRNVEAYELAISLRG